MTILLNQGSGYYSAGGRNGDKAGQMARISVSHEQAYAAMREWILES
jgi:hypothetical protein